MPKTTHHFFLTVPIVTISFLLTACSFNNMVFQAERVPPTVKEMKIKTPADTIVVHLAKNDSQIIITKSNGDTLDLKYTIENVFFKSSNGDTLNGWFLKPKNQTATVTLLHLHGNGGFLLSHLQTISPLIKTGFQIFMFDYSGYGFSQGEAARKNVLTDALSALDYIRSRKEVKNTNLVIYGQSLGGHYAAVVATRRQSDIDGLVLEGAFTSYKAMAEHMIPVLGYIFMKQGYHADKMIKGFHKPLLVIHSLQDKIVPFKMGKKIFNNANAPKEFFKSQKCHICGPKYYTDEISEKIKNMLTGNYKLY